MQKDYNKMETIQFQTCYQDRKIETSKNPSRSKTVPNLFCCWRWGTRIISMSCFQWSTAKTLYSKIVKCKISVKSLLNPTNNDEIYQVANFLTDIENLHTNFYKWIINVSVLFVLSWSTQGPWSNERQRKSNVYNAS